MQILRVLCSSQPTTKTWFPHPPSKKSPFLGPDTKDGLGCSRISTS